MIKVYKWYPIIALVVVLTSIFLPQLFDRKKMKSALAETTLGDIKNHWAKACIEDLLEQEIISGYYEDETFRPNAPVTRAEFAAMINRAFPNVKSVREPINFVDVPQDYWGYDPIIKAYQKGFLSGYIGKTFNPTLKITRWQVLTALTQGLNYQASESTVENLDIIFADAEEIPEASKKTIAAATEKGIVVNYPNVRKLNPNQDATRSDVAVFLCQALANNQTNNDELISKVPSEYIAKISVNEQQTTTATIPEPSTETTETSANTNPETPAENTPPGIVERFGNGNLQAEIIYEQANNTDLVSNLRLKIIRNGEVILNEPVPLKSLEENSDDSSIAVLAGRFVKVQLLDLDGDQESEVLVDLVTINNSNVPLDGGTYSLIYRYDSTKNRYIKLQHFWGNVNYRITDLDKDNIPEFKTVDTRFANVFTDINNSAFPVQIWQYRQGKMLDITQEYPVQINTSASELWLEFYRRSTQNQDVKGVLAAYLANKYMLDQKEDGWNLIEKVYQESDREEYFANLRQFLVDKGYAKNEQIASNAVVEQNSSTETEETVTFTTNETEETSPQITETENTEETSPPETTTTENQTTTPTENIEETSPPETTTTENQPTTQTETENTETQITLPPQTSSQTTETEISDSETETETSNELVLIPRLVRSLSTPQTDFASAIAISSDGKILASSSAKDIQLWNLETGKLLNTLSSHKGNVRSVAISPGGETLASGSGDGTVKLWDISTGELITSLWHSGVVTAVGFTANGRAVVGCSSDRGMKLWNIYTRQLLHRMNGTQPIAFGADGFRMATSGGPRYIRLWNVAQGQLLKNLAIPITNNDKGIQAIAFSQDGKTIAHAMKGESKILVWDVETWEMRYSLEKHSEKINAIAISQDGKMLASSSADGNINLWNISNGRLLRSIKGYGAIVFTPDGQQLVSVTEDNTIQLWQIYGSVIEQ